MKCKEQTREALKRALAHFGTQEKMADALGTSQPSVSRWLAAGRIGVDYVLKAEDRTGVSRHDLRPDLYPRETLHDTATGSRFKGVDRNVGARTQLEGRLTA